MRFLLVNLALLSALLIPAFAQQPDSPQSQPKTETQTKTNAASKKAQAPPAKSPETPAATEEQKPEAAKESGDKAKDKEEHFDMTEVAPIVTHHQITVNGKTAALHGHRRTPSHQARGRQNRSRDVFRGLHPGWTGGQQASPDLCLQRRAGLVVDLVAHGSAGAQDG